MKKQSLFALGAALFLACGSALAGTATFSGSTGDTALQLPGVAYDTCSFVISPGGSVDLADLLGEFPFFSTGPGTIDLSLVSNGTAGGTLGIELRLIDNTVTPNGFVAARLTSTQVYLERGEGGSTSTLGTPVDASGVTTIQLELTATNIVLRYHDGNSLQDVVSVNLANVGSLNEDLTGDRIFELKLVAGAAGPAWAVNRIVWTDDAVPDTNDPVGCDVSPVPDVIGLSLAAATTALQNAGFTVNATYDGDINSASPGLVVSQNPAPGSLVVGGSVDIVIGGIEVLNDSDGDGLDDDWETTNFGDLSQGRWGDPDMDRSWNVREFLNDTDPNNPESSVPVADYRGLMLLALLLAAVGVVAAVRMGRNHV